MTVPSSTRRVQRVRHEIKRRDLAVARVDAMSPSFRSVVFAGDSLADFISASFDDHVKFMLNADEAEPIRRDYTPRAYDRAACELTIEFSLHGDGPVANWARQAKPGQRATIGGPRGSMIIPMDYDWHLLVGDETALPAISRRLEELPGNARVIVIGQAEDPADQRVFSGAVSPDVRWVGNDSDMLEAVRSLPLPQGEGFAWCAGESAAMVALRRILVTDKGHDPKAIRAAAYWKRGAVAHHENLED